MRSEIRWSWVLTGMLITLCGLILYFGFSYWWNTNQCSEPTDNPIARLPGSRNKNFYGENNRTVKDKSYQKKSAKEDFPQTAGKEKADEMVFQEANKKYFKNPQFALLAFQLAENKTNNNATKSSKPAPTSSPKPDETPPKKEKRNILEKIYDWFAGLFRKKKKPANVNSVSVDKKTVVLPCPPEEIPADGSCPGDMSVRVSAAADNPENGTLIYNYIVSGGRIVGSGANVVWDLSGAGPGTYTITAGAGNGQDIEGKTITETITVSECSCRQENNRPPVSVTGSPGVVKSGETIIFTANVSGGNQTDFTYNWTIDKGNIIEGQGTPTITVDTDGLENTTVTATVYVGSLTGTSDENAAATVTIAPATRKGSIKGRITDASGNGIPNVTVTVTDTKTEKIITTDIDGYYIFANLEPGNYKIKARGAGFQASWGDAEVLEDQSTTYNLTFDSSNTNTNTNTNNTNNINTSTDGNSSTNGGIKNNTNAVTNLSNVNSNVSNANSNLNANTSENANTPINSNTAANSNQPTVAGTDLVGFDYPAYYFKDTVHTVNLSLDYVEGWRTPTSVTVNVGNVITNQTTARADISVPAHIDLSKYDIYVTAALEPVENLQVVTTPEKPWQKYEKIFFQNPKPSWSWQVKLPGSAEDAEPVRFGLRLDYGFKLKAAPENSQSYVSRKTAWKSELKGRVGLPFLVRFLSYLTVPGGLLFSFLGFVHRKSAGEIPGTLTAARNVGDQVQCALYSPSKVKAGNDFLVQVFAFLEEDSENIAGIAQTTDEEAKRQAVSRLNRPIERGATLVFELKMSDVGIDEPIQQHIWDGNILEVPFIISTSEDMQPGVKIGKLIVSENSVPLGRLIFKVSIGSETSPEKELGGNLEPYEYAFISYASEDRPEVLKRVMAISAARIQFFQDILSLDPGVRWERELYKHIDRCEVVFLFWSRAASRSEWVEKEILYAFARRNGVETAPPDIVPIILEGPPPVPPPDTLKFLHFNDKFLYLISAAEAEREIKKNKPD